MQLSGLSALVVGGASGLGRAAAERLAKFGARVVIADLPHSDGASVAAGLENGLGAFAPTVSSVRSARRKQIEWSACLCALTFLFVFRMLPRTKTCKQRSMQLVSVSTCW